MLVQYEVIVIVLCGFVCCCFVFVVVVVLCVWVVGEYDSCTINILLIEFNILSMLA